MSVFNAIITNEYQLLSSDKATFTVKEFGGGSLLFNTTDADDETAIPLHRNAETKQVAQIASVATYVRHTGEAGNDWRLIVDSNVIEVSAFSDAFSEAFA